VKATSRAFRENAARALADQRLQQALGRARGGFVDKRAAAVAALPEFDALRERAQAIKDHTLAHLDWYLERFEERVTASGGQVHWARDTTELQETVLEICRTAGARRVTKGKSMVGEEAALNEALEGAGLEVTETDLGEYIIQLAKEPPSHIIAPAVHKTREQVDELFHRFHRDLDPRPLTEVAELVNEARRVLRDRFLAADVGITGANFLVAETGSALVVTNEGNGDLTATLPRVHIVTASIEKVVPNLDDAATLLRLLARSATGQEFTSYTTLFTGPRRPEDPDGPEAFHVVLLDNGRSGMLGGPFREMLRCIRCGACMNHCPVYGAVGGHAYGWVYPGPMGSVLSPMLAGLEQTYHLPEASTLCGRCAEVCPVRIPLPSLLRRLRERKVAEKLTRAGASGCGARWPHALRSTASARGWPPGCSAASAGAAAPSPLCPVPAAGRPTGICPHRPERPSWRAGGVKGVRHEQCPQRHPRRTPCEPRPRAGGAGHRPRPGAALGRLPRRTASGARERPAGALPRQGREGGCDRGGGNRPGSGSGRGCRLPERGKLAHAARVRRGLLPHGSAMGHQRPRGARRQRGRG